MRKHIVGATVVALALVMAPGWTGGAPGAVESVVGLGVASALGCMVCGGAGVAIAGSGWGAVLQAIWAPGSLAVAGACVGICFKALGY